MNREITLSGTVYRVTTNSEDACISLAREQITDRIDEITVSIRFPEPQEPNSVSVSWTMPAKDMYAVWATTFGYNVLPLRVDWSKRTTEARLASHAPLQSIFSQSGRNRLTLALSDASVSSRLRTGVNEERADMTCELQLFTESPREILQEYSVRLRVDTTDEPYYETLKRVERWWGEACGYPCAYIPEAAKRAMYSTWYSYHQRTIPEELLRECRMAKALGMESIIVDDGWQTDDGSRGYSYCGDWRPTPAKIPDMKQFVDDVHAIGLKFILWYSVPYVGVMSEAYERFKDMKLYQVGSGERSWMALDPRFPEVRRYLVDTYRNAMLDWGLDGFKLDFIDSMRARPETPKSDPRWDIPTLNEAIDTLLAEITRELRAINPDVLIEFRQAYVGPVIRKHGNMFRVGDCPADSILNRINTVQLRYLLGESAVHSDMLMWHYEDTPEAAAKQIIASLFSVLQISVRLAEIPESHMRMLRNYMDFWNANREILLDGALRAYHPEAQFSLVEAEKDNALVAVAYLRTPVTLEKPYGRVAVVNGSGEKGVLLETPENARYAYTVFDCMGEILSTGKLAEKSLAALDVPDSGRVELTLCS